MTKGAESLLALSGSSQRSHWAPASNETLLNGAHVGTVHAWFEEQAARNPEAIALIMGAQRITYGEVNERANRLARHLAVLGVGNEALVGVCLRRSFDLVVALLAVLKAGGAYVPLDPDYPAERLEFMLRDTLASVVITDSSCSERLPRQIAKLLLVDREAAAIEPRGAANLNLPVATTNLIYVMYTSGSTGSPKGVMIEHRGVTHLVKNTDYLAFDAGHRFMQLAPICFDASTLEIWGPLLNGGSLVLMPPGTPSLEDIAAVIRNHEVTTVWLPAGLFNLMIDQHLEALRLLKQLVTGGDSGSLAHFRAAVAGLPGCRLVNGYGPTEATTFAVCLTARREHLEGGSVPIGFPISGTPVWVLDSEFDQVPAGEAGELYIGGDGVARGYLNQRDLTAQKFVVPPWETDTSRRLYRTGDQVRLRPDGALEFLGRVDDQVKIHGYRVEPGEIAETLRQHPAVRDAVVLAEKDSREEKRLIAYVMPRSRPAPGQHDLCAFLMGKLPHYMVPGSFVTVDEIPLTPNGKVDRAALARLRADTPVTRSAHESGARTTAIEATISSVWREVLRLPSADIDATFFDLGGDSLQLIEVHAKLQRVLARKFEITDLFQYPTVASLAAHLSIGARAAAAGNGSDPGNGNDPGFRAQRQRELLSRRAR
jgi:amino acid adenylation domain-containing protein